VRLPTGFLLEFVMKLSHLFAVALITVSVPQSATAGPDDYGGGWAVPSLDTSISISNDIVRRQIFDNQILNSRNSSSGETRSVNRSALQVTPRVASEQQIFTLNFTPSATRRKANFAQFVAKTRADNPEGAAQMAQLFASTDVIGAIGKGIAPFGLRVNNLADAYTVYWTNAWLGSRGRDDTLSKQQIAAVRNQAANALLATPGIASASDAGKQEMAEAMLVQAALIEAYVGNAKSDPALMSKVKAAIAQGAKGMGLDLYTMTLTDNGFVPVKRGSAVEDGDIPSLPGDTSSEAELASNTAGEITPNYALIAAAGGAGLGGMFLLGKMMGRRS
jgi:hypothetical protein